MSEDVTLDDFVTEDEREETDKKRPIEAIPGSSVESSLDETSVGEIPDDWKATRLEDIAKETEYGLTESAEPYDPEKPRYIRTQDFDDFGGLKNDSRASLAREKAKDGLLEKGDMLFARSGSVGASLGKTFLYETKYGECCFGGYSIRHRLQKEGLNHKYISQYTLGEQYWDWVRRRAKTTAQSNINTGEYGSLLIPVPPLSEQRKIATVLYIVDQAIQKTEEIIEQTERVDTGLLQSLFSGEHLDCEYRTESTLGEIPRHWNSAPMEEVCEITMGSSPKSEYYNESGEGLPFFQANNEFGLRNPTNDRWCSNPVKIAEAGDSLMTIRGTYVGQMNIADRECCIGRGLAGISAGERLSSEYLYHHLRRRERYVKSIAIGSTFDSISSDDLANLLIAIPPKDEQKEIADSLKSIQQQIIISNQYIRALKNLKSGLMQDLLSGTVRTTNTNIEVPDEIAQHG